MQRTCGRTHLECARGAQVSDGSDRRLPSRFRYVHDAKVFLRKPSDDPTTPSSRKGCQPGAQQSYWRAWKDGHLTPAQLIGVPAFIAEAACVWSSTASCRARCSRCLATLGSGLNPGESSCPRTSRPGLHRSNYDRMTVAYGLTSSRWARCESAPSPNCPWTQRHPGQRTMSGKEHCWRQATNLASLNGVVSGRRRRQRHEGPRVGPRCAGAGLDQNDGSSNGSSACVRRSWR